MKIYEIEYGSDAWEWLAWAIQRPDTRTLRIANDEGLFKVKVNENTWSPALNTKKGQS